MVLSFSSLFRAIFNLWGIFQTPKYDVIVVGAGAGGCILAQTLVEAGLYVLLVERGDEPNAVTRNARTTNAGLRDVCTEPILSLDGIVLAAGNCMGGGSSVNAGVWIEETPEWIQRVFGTGFATKAEIEAANVWIRTRLAPKPKTEAPGSPAETYIQDLIATFDRSADFEIGDLDGSPQIHETGVWRAHSIFDSVTGVRSSADTVLDRQNPLLDILKNSKVVRFLFDGDKGVPKMAGFRPTDTPRARCVRLATLEVICVKHKGRIYISAGTFHSPELLIQSGIGPQGSKVQNAQVGQNFADKPGLIAVTNFQRNFTYTNQQTTANIVAPFTVKASNNKTSLVLYEESSYGFSALLDGQLFSLTLLPTSARDSFLARGIVTFADFCNKLITKEDKLLPVGLLCAIQKDIDDLGCDSTIGAMLAFLSEPTSRGNLTLGPDGELRVWTNHMSTPEDREFFAAMVRTLYHIKNNVTGTSAPLRPCTSSDGAECSKTSCPAKLKSFADTLNLALKVVAPNSADEYPKAPASTVFPNYIQQILNENADNAVAGELLRESIFSIWNSVGTNAMGQVVDQRFKVTGVDGLYVVDGSVLPTSSRGNSQATVMLIGRLGGIRGVQELTTT